MYWRGSVLTHEPILDAPKTVARESDVPVGAASILARVAAASYVGTLLAWLAGTLVLGTVQLGATAFHPAGPPEGMTVYLAAGGPLK